MAKQFISLTTRIDLWKDYFNDLTNDVGDLATLTTSGDSDIVQAINEHDAELGTITSGAMGTTASTVSGAIAEHDAELGTITSLAMGTTASTVSTAIAELDGRLDSINDTQINSPYLYISDSSQTNIIRGGLDIHGNGYIGGILTADSATVDGWLTSSKIRSASGDALRLEENGQNINLTTSGILFGSFSTTGTELVITNGASDTMTLQTDGDLALSGTADFVPGITLITTATGLGGAVNELKSSISTLEGVDSNIDSSLSSIFAQIGDLASLNDSIDSRTNLVSAINETWDRIPNIYDENDTLLNG